MATQKTKNIQGFWPETTRLPGGMAAAAAGAAGAGRPVKHAALHAMLLCVHYPASFP
jgi:hypothetical protein